MKTRISALVDGELETSESKSTVAALSRDKEQKSIWYSYHIIGDVMRHESDLTIDVSSRVMAALSLEPTVLSPHPQRRAKYWQRPLIALAASAAGVAVVAWVAVAPVQMPVGSLIQANRAIMSPAVSDLAMRSSTATRMKVASSSVSSTPALTTVAGEEQAARLQEYLMAHQAYQGGALVGGASHIRTVSVSGIHR